MENNTGERRARSKARIEIGRLARLADWTVGWSTRVRGGTREQLQRREIQLRRESETEYWLEEASESRLSLFVSLLYREQRVCEAITGQ